MAVAPTILVVDDDPELLELMRYHLTTEGFHVKTFPDASLALRYVTESRPHLVLLDLAMPALDGFGFCQAVKSRYATYYLPIIVISGRDEEEDVVRAFEMGADDYLIKPFRYPELIARIRAVLRRAEWSPVQPTPDRMQIGQLEIDIVGHEVRLGGQSLALTRTEFLLLVALVKSQGRTLHRQELIQEMTEEGRGLIDKNVDVRIGMLRQKLGSHAWLIRTVRGVGYKCVAA